MAQKVCKIIRYPNRSQQNGKSTETFLSYGAEQVVNVENEQFIIYYGRHRYPVGFTIELIDFQAPRYPGTNRPARFQSLVNLIDQEKNLKEERLVYMNNPLAYNNFLVYQSSYIEGEQGRPDISIFSVARAPGTGTIYFGSIVLCIGMILMFGTTQYSSINYRRYSIKK